jgi:hypothetical protein
MMITLRALIPIAALLLPAMPALAQDVGVAAAVNQSAQSIRNAQVRTIGLGDNVIYNERIDTNSDGLVQLLLADGTTFTIGPNSSLTIDSFVYNPEAGTAQVAATLTKGVLRFIGAATSKTPDGVAITTPVGVVGIRGGVTDINMNPPSGIPPHISMIFGNSVTLSRPAATSTPSRPPPSGRASSSRRCRAAPDRLVARCRAPTMATSRPSRMSTRTRTR